MFKKPNKQFERDQIVFIVTTMIAGCIDNISSSIPQRWMDGRNDEGWKRDLADFHKCWNSDSFFQANLNQLGWNLSILYAQVEDDGMGVSDALGTPINGTTLEELLTSWYYRTLEGKLGVAPSPSDAAMGTPQEPDSEELASAWVACAFPVEIPE